MNTIVRVAFVAALVCPAAAAAGPQQTSSQAPPGALPYDLAFGMASFIWDTQFAVSADGRFVAYDVRVPPADTTANLDERYQPNGTPSSVVGATIRYTEMASKRTVEVCPGGTCWRPVWSPDGALIAFFSDADGEPQLWVHDVAAGMSRRLSEEPVKPKLWHGDEPRWSPDGSTLYVGFAPEGPFSNPMRPAEVRPENPAGVVVLRSGSEAAAAPEAEAPPPTPMTDHYAREHLVAIKAVDVASGETRVLVAQDAEFPAGTLRRSASGRWLGYLSIFRPESDTTQSTVMDVAVVPTAGGEPIPAVRNVPLTRNDYFGVSYAWHPSDDRLVYLDGKRMHLLDLRTGSPAAPMPLAPELGDVAPTVFAFTRDGQAAVMGVDVVDDQGYGDPRPRALAVVPLDGSPPATFALDDDRWTYDQVLKADERTAWQPDDESISVLVTERATGSKAILRYDPATDDSRVLWKARARLVNLTSGGSHDFIVGQYEDMRTPSNIFRFDADFSARERISHIDPRLDDVEVGTAEVFETTVPLHDGTLATVKTAVLLPPGATRGDRLPALVTMYPGSDITRRAAAFGGGSVFTVPNLVFTSRGYAVVLCDLTLGPNQQAGNPIRDMVDVLLPQVYRAAELGYVDLNRLAITGQSFGGYGTGSIITRTNIFRAAVPISGIFDLFGTYGRIDVDGGGFFLAWSEGGQARMGTHPWADVRRYLDNSPYYNADKISTPVLIVHGTEDMAYHDAGKLFSALRRLGKPAQLASYLDQGHVISSWRRSSAIDAARRMVEFYRRHLGDPAKGREDSR
ncbi:MAG: prolyl oligopeptidase family serine peptidase [Gemmatimonadetes bacterium]|nr:prolyl oligopeptidase family serine peptidase [Candidatus Palauibacter rhopaloidicola]